MKIRSAKIPPADRDSRFVWLNPVIGQMAGAAYPALLEALAGRGYTITACPEAPTEVRQAYLSRLGQSRLRPLIDARCPRVATLIREDFPHLSARIAPIPPILIVCAGILYRRHVAPDPGKASLTVITPCSELADYGKALFGDRIRFETWKAFQRTLGLGRLYPRADASPIPPGFFDYPGVRVLEGSGDGEVRDLLGQAQAGRLDPGVEILELLYCRDGCHNGDGV